MRRCWQLELVVLLLLASAPALRGQDKPSETDEQRADRLKLMKQQAAAYTLTLAGSKTELALHDDPVLRFSNPVSGVPDGIVAMWKDGKRPAVFAQVFQTKDGLWVHECQSLAAAGLAMTKGGNVFWEPKEAAEAFRRLDDDVPAPAATPGRRLAQMKDIAAQFTAADDFKINTTDPEPTRHTLRLLTTPIYRYEDAESAIQDGAVFAFVHGTDPEVFLVLESRLPAKGDANDRIGWHYTLAPMTCWAVTVGRNEKEVWSLPERLNQSKPGDLYHVWLHRTLRLPFMR
jgi:hypothetical protein